MNTYATKHIVQVSNFVFTPASIPDVAVGDTIRWVWISGSHNTTSTTIPTGANGWANPITSSEPTFDYKVLLAGNYDYVCTPHASMGMVGSFTATGVIPTLTVSPSNQEVSASAGNTTFSVTSNSGWTSSSNANWCIVTHVGSGNGVITATYEGNPLFTERIAEITVHVTGIPTKTVTVTQDGSTVSIDEKPMGDIRVFPNPLQDFFTLSTGLLGLQTLDVSIVDLSGRILQTHHCSGSSEYRFDMTMVPEGVFFIRVEADDKITSRKIIVTR